jgi:hypothetical protein
MPPRGWRPNPAWPPPPAGWQLYVSDDFAPADVAPGAFGTRDNPFATGNPARTWAPAGQGPAAHIQASQPPPVQAYPGSPDYPGGPGYPDGPGYPRHSGGHRSAPDRGTSGFAIASFILGIFGMVLFSVGFGIAALVRIRDRPQRGKGLAITGLVLSGVWILGVGALIAFAHSYGQPHRSASTGQISAKGTVSIFSLRPGDCFQNPTSDATLLGVAYVTADPCTTAHNAQIFADFSATGTDYPGDAALERQANIGCPARVAGTLDKSKITSAMSLHFLYPQQSWADGHRTITCVIVNPTSDLTSSLMAPPTAS